LFKLLQQCYKILTIALSKQHNLKKNKHNKQLYFITGLTKQFLCENLYRYLGFFTTLIINEKAKAAVIRSRDIYIQKKTIQQPNLLFGRQKQGIAGKKNYIKEEHGHVHFSSSG
jgi:hypothetical protein